MGHESSSLLPLFFSKVLERIKRVEPMILVWWCLTVCVVSASINRFSTESSGFTYHALLIMGTGGCAWFWFLCCTLFRDRQDLKPRLFIWVPVIITIEVIDVLVPHTGTTGIAYEMRRVFSNAASMVCIASIVFVCNEILTGYSKIRSTAERHFRIVFLSVYSLLMGVAMLWVSGAGADSFAAEWKAVLLTACAIAALAGSRAAIHYRLRLSREKAARFERTHFVSMHDESLELLAQKILNAIGNETLLTTPYLKVSEFADHIGEQEYKVTRCITSCLQYRNFNHFLNSYRIDRAQGIFNDPNSRHLTIATIAFDCGFNSIGPFNRAFKQYTGMTPREFRRQMAL